MVVRSGKKDRVNDERRVSMCVEKIRKQCKKIPHWKAPGRDGVQGYWIKNPAVYTNVFPHK